MLEKATIARPYAEAAFSQAVDEGTLSDWSVFLSKLELVVSDVDMRSVISSPKLSDEQLADFITEICGEGLSQTQKNFIRVLVDAERITLVPELSSLFEHNKSAAEGISEVDVISAYALDESQLTMLSESISRKLGKKIEINASEDRDLIGGLIVRSGDSVIDASLQGRLKELNNIFAQ